MKTLLLKDFKKKHFNADTLTDVKITLTHLVMLLFFISTSALAILKFIGSQGDYQSLSILSLSLLLTFVFGLFIRKPVILGNLSIAISFMSYFLVAQDWQAFYFLIILIFLPFWGVLLADKKSGIAWYLIVQVFLFYFFLKDENEQRVYHWFVDSQKYVTVHFIAINIVMYTAFIIIYYYHFFIEKIISKLVLSENKFLENEVKLKEALQITKENELELKRKEHLLEKIFDISPAGLRVIDSKQKIVRANKLYSTYSNNEIKDIIGRSCNELFCFNSCKANNCQLKKISENKLENDRVNEFTIDNSTKKKYFVVNAIPITEENGEITGYLQSYRDITKFKENEIKLIEAKEDAEESDRLKSAFLANMSHEIRTPMNSIIGYSSLLAKQNFTEDKKKEFIERIQRNSNQLLLLISDILDISKIEASLLEIYEQPFNLNQLIQELQVQFNLHKNKSQNVVIRSSVALADSKSIILSDKNRLVQIISNLLSNAIKFTKEGYIEFGYNLDKENTILFYVKDTGIGIEEKNHKRIFIHFRQEAAATSAHFGGTGLGLSICRGILKLMNGEIWINSEKGKGSTFYFTLPYNPVEEEIVDEKEIENEFLLPNYEAYTILIVEDNVDSMTYITELMSSTDIKIIQCTNGLDAVELCKKNDEIDIVLMDIQLPTITGIEATKKIKALRKDLPIIAQTAYAYEEDKSKAFDAGCDGYITKPIDSKELFLLLSKFLAFSCKN